VGESAQLDCRGQGDGAGRAVVDAFNALVPGARLTACVDSLPVEFKIWMLEAGVRYTAAAQPDGSFRLDLERGLSPAQGTIPGVHHIVADDEGSVWTCERARRIARFDAGSPSFAVAATSSAAHTASHLALDDSGKLLYIADAGAREVLALRASDLKLVDKWATPGVPHLPAVSPEGIVCVTGSATGTLTIARPGTVGGHYDVLTVAVGACPHDPLIGGDGAHVYVPCAGDGNIVKVRLDDGFVVGRSRAGDGPAHLAAHPDGRIYAANSWDGTVSCMSGEGESLGSAASGGWAHAIDITPDGRQVWVANFLDDTVSVFDADTLERLAVLETERYPHGLDVTPDGRYVVATGFGSRHVRIYDAAALTQVARIEVGVGSSHTAFVPGAALAFIPCSVDDHVACVDLTALRRLHSARLDQGATP
jgi:YVTN family beta-propeller protein